MAVMSEQDKKAADWSHLAKDALDLWQNHLTSLACDPKAKEEMARFVAPMTEAMTGWSQMMQTGMHEMMKMAASAAEQAQATSGEAQAAPSSPAPQDGAQEEEAAAPSAVPSAAPPQEAEAPACAGEDGKREPAAMEPFTASPVLAPAPVCERGSEPAPATAPAGAGGRASGADSGRSLAELAGRLAVLERELDQLRPRPRRKDAAAEPGADGADGPVAGADQTPPSA